MWSKEKTIEWKVPISKNSHRDKRGWYGACKKAYKVAAFAALAAGCIKVSPLEVRYHKRIVKVGSRRQQILS